MSKFSVSQDQRDVLFNAEQLSGVLFSSDGFRAAEERADVLEKATGAVLCVTGVANRNDVDAAVIAATDAQAMWAQQDATLRGDVVRRFAELLSQHREEVIEWIIRESGSVKAKALFEVDLSIRETLEASTLATRPEGLVLSKTNGRTSMATRVPVGVVGIITPWNSPLILAVRGIMPALALGNSVVLKPDVQTPVCGGFLIAALLQKAGLPDGLLHVLPGAAATGEALVAHNGVHLISFTGSTGVGRQVGETAGKLLKRVALELGGNNPFIVRSDADIDRAAMAGAFGSFFHQGQICFTIGRHLVHVDVVEQYVENLVKRASRLKVGDPFRGDVQLGPIINERQAQRAQRILDESIASGARVVAGGKRDGLFFEPTVVTHVTPDMPLFHEETFGPVAAVLSFRDDEEAIELANNTEFGLAAAVQSRSLQHAQAIASRLKTGIVHINDQPVIHEVYGPIGGMGESGNGARTGLPAWEHEYTQWRWQTVNDVSPDYPF
jgi:benzaldehyde dehydrogenase (NAD)